MPTQPVELERGQELLKSFFRSKEQQKKQALGGDQDDRSHRGEFRSRAVRLGSSHRSTELAWRRNNPETLSRLVGEWVVLEGEEIIAHGDDLSQLVEQARTRGVEVPYVFYVEDTPPDVARIGL